MYRSLKEYVCFVAIGVTFFAVPLHADVKPVPSHKQGKTSGGRPIEEARSKSGNELACESLKGAVQILCQGLGRDPENLETKLSGILKVAQDLKCNTLDTDPLVWAAFDYERVRLARAIEGVAKPEESELFSALVRRGRAKLLVGTSEQALKDLADEFAKFSQYAKKQELQLAAKFIENELRGRPHGSGDPFWNQTYPIIVMAPLTFRTLPVFDEQPASGLVNICGAVEMRNQSRYLPKARLAAMEFALALSLRSDRREKSSNLMTQVMGATFHEEDRWGTRIRQFERLIAKDLAGGFFIPGKEGIPPMESHHFASQILAELKAPSIPYRPSARERNENVFVVNRNGNTIDILLPTICKEWPSTVTVTRVQTVNHRLHETERFEFRNADFTEPVTMKIRPELGATQIHFVIPRSDQDRWSAYYEFDFLCNAKRSEVRFKLTPFEISESTIHSVAEPIAAPDYQAWDSDGVRKGVSLIFDSEETVSGELLGKGFTCENQAIENMGSEILSTLGNSKNAVDYVISELISNGEEENSLGWYSKVGTRIKCTLVRGGKTFEHIILTGRAGASEREKLSLKAVQKIFTQPGGKGRLTWVDRTEQGHGFSQASPRLFNDTFLAAAIPAHRFTALRETGRHDKSKRLAWIEALNSQFQYADFETKFGIDKRDLPHLSDERQSLQSELRRMREEVREENASYGLVADFGQTLDRFMMSAQSGDFNFTPTDREQFAKVFQGSPLNFPSFDGRHFTPDQIGSLYDFMGSAASSPSNRVLKNFWLKEADLADLEGDIPPYTLAMAVLEGSKVAAHLFSSSPNRQDIAEILLVEPDTNLDPKFTLPYLKDLSSASRLEHFLATFSVLSARKLAPLLNPEQKRLAIELLENKIDLEKPDSTLFEKILLLDPGNKKTGHALERAIEQRGWPYPLLLKDTVNQAESIQRALKFAAENPGYHASTILDALNTKTSLIPEIVDITEKHLLEYLKDPTEAVRPDRSKYYYEILKDAADRKNLKARELLVRLALDPTLKQGSNVTREVWKGIAFLEPPELSLKDRAFELVHDENLNNPYPAIYLKNLGQVAAPYGKKLIKNESAGLRGIGWEILAHTNEAVGDFKKEVIEGLKSEHAPERMGVLAFLGKGFLDSEIENEVIAEVENAFKADSGSELEREMAISTALRFASPEKSLKVFPRLKQILSNPNTTIEGLKVPAAIQTRFVEEILNRPVAYIRKEGFAENNLQAMRALALSGNAQLRKKVWDILYYSEVSPRALSSFQGLMQNRLKQEGVDGEEADLLYGLLDRIREPSK